MRLVQDIALDENQRGALEELKNGLQQQFPIAAMILFGSVTRGEADEESDIDVLIVSQSPVDRQQRHRISDIVLEINLKYNTNISTVVVNRHDWELGPISVLPFHDNVTREGVRI
ncbi:MAG: nucleotidyltransferase domain-containing protein [Candidatus Poribacteria bacterium]|nr:nucleotidyltransferase domain-containing protein [Candidatus Poribacteria bacterium]